MGMLSHKAVSLDVSCLHMGLLKKLILQTMDGATEQRQKALRREMIAHHGDSESSDNEAMEDQNLIEELKARRKELSIQILKDNICVISTNLHQYWTNHMKEIKSAISSKGIQRAHQKRNVSTKQALSASQLEHSKRLATAKDLLFI